MSRLTCLTSRLRGIVASNNNLQNLNFTTKKLYSSAAATTSNDNVFKSKFSDVSGFEDKLIHEYVWQRSDRWMDKIALESLESGKTYTYAQLRRHSLSLAKSLVNTGLQPGSTIGLVMPNIPEYAIVLLAASEAGYKVTLINPAYTSVEIRRQLENSEASMVITSLECHEVVRASMEGNARLTLPPIVVNDKSRRDFPQGCIMLEELMEAAAEQSQIIGQRGDNSETAYLPYSSGTTGLPKGVELSHRNVVSNMCQISHKELHHGLETTSTYQDVIPAILPFFHIYGLVITLLHYLSHGAKIVTVNKFSLEKLIELMERKKPTLLYVAPPLVQLLAYNDNIKDSYFDSLRFVMSGAAPLGKEMAARFQARCPPRLRLLQGYGLTETSPVLTMSRGAPSEVSGYVIPNTDMRIVKDGASLPMGEIGEIQVRGPQVMKGYYKNEKATSHTMDGEWYKTGDLGSVSEEGLLTVSGRLKELIKVSGYQVPPAELEEILRENDKVVDVAVIGVEHQQYGEIPKAFVVAKRGANVSEDEIKDFVAKRVVKYKQLGQVQFVEQIPKSAAGKILRRELANM